MINMEEAKLRTLEQVKVFLDGTSEVAFRVPKEGRNQFIERVLKRFGYGPTRACRQGRVATLPGAYARLVSPAGDTIGASVPQGWEADTASGHGAQARLHLPLYRRRRGLAGRNGYGCIAPCPDPPPRGSWSVPCECLAMRVSNGWRAFRFPICTTRRGAKQYQNQRRHWTKTNPTGVPIGQRRAPPPDGLPGHIRIDSVHQGDQDGVKGVYHINAVDCVTQMQFIATCEKISEAYLHPVIRQ